MGVCEFEDDTITAWCDYVDMGLMTRGASGEPLDSWFLPLVEAGEELL